MRPTSWKDIFFFFALLHSYGSPLHKMIQNKKRHVPLQYFKFSISIIYAKCQVTYGTDVGDMLDANFDYWGDHVQLCGAFRDALTIQSNFLTSIRGKSRSAHRLLNPLARIKSQTHCHVNEVNNWHWFWPIMAYVSCTPIPYLSPHVKTTGSATGECSSLKGWQILTRPVSPTCIRPDLEARIIIIRLLFYKRRPRVKWTWLLVNRLGQVCPCNPILTRINSLKSNRRSGGEEKDEMREKEEVGNKIESWSRRGIKVISIAKPTKRLMELL